MSDSSQLPEQSQTEAQPPLDVTAGSAEIPGERKVMIAVCAICLLIFCGSLIALAFWTHVGLGLISIALIAWWLGSSIAETLKETRGTSSPNH